MMRRLYYFLFFLACLTEINTLQTLAQEAKSFEEAVALGRHAATHYQYAEAVKWYELALKQAPNSADLRVALAMQYIGLEQLNQAEREFLHAIEINPRLISALNNLGILYQKFKNNFSLAETYYRQAIDAAPLDPTARKLLGEMFLSLGKDEQALDAFQALIQAAPNSPLGYLGAGQTQLRNGDARAAVGNLIQAAKLAPRDPDAYRFLAQAFAKTGERDKAKKMRARFQALQDAKVRLDDLKRLVRREPDNAQRWFACGREYVKHKDADEAIHAFEMGLELDPNDSAVHAMLGALYLLKEKPLEAFDHLEPAAKALPNDANTQNQLGVCYLMLEDYPRAVEQFEKAIALGGVNPGVQKNLEIASRKALQDK